jgi:hypothetical protein
MEDVERYGAEFAARLHGLPPELRRRLVLEHLRQTWDEPAVPVATGSPERASKRDKPGTVWNVRSHESARHSHGQ